MKRGRSSNNEFTDEVKEVVIFKSNSCCEKCHRRLTEEQYTFHHLLPVWYATLFFPDISYLVLRCIENCQLLCRGCHDLEHGHENPKQRYTQKKHFYERQARILRNLDLTQRPNDQLSQDFNKSTQRRDRKNRFRKTNVVAR